MKTFKDILSETVDKPRSPDEQNFIDKHIIDKRKYPLDTDDQFSGDIKGSKRKKRLADLEDGEDKKIYEESGSEMTPAQMKKREEIVLSLKKKMDEFKSRYGDKAKDVMYATATKMAMKEEHEINEGMGLYRYNKVTGYWKLEREVTPETKDKWLDIFTKDSPKEHFVVSSKKPTKNPMKEEAVEVSEGVLEDLKDIVSSKSMKAVTFTDGKKQKVDLTTASMVLSVHKQLNPENKTKVENMLNDSKKFMQIVQFAMSAGK
jgi:hypothetical protein